MSKRRQRELKRLSSKEAVRLTDEGRLDEMFIEVREAAQWLGPPYGDLLAALQEGQLTAYLIDGRAMLKGNELLMWMAQHDRLPRHAQ